MSEPLADRASPSLSNQPRPGTSSLGLFAGGRPFPPTCWLWSWPGLSLQLLVPCSPGHTDETGDSQVVGRKDSKATRSPRPRARCLVPSLRPASGFSWPPAQRHLQTVCLPKIPSPSKPLAAQDGAVDRAFSSRRRSRTSVHSGLWLRPMCPVPARPHSQTPASPRKQHLFWGEEVRGWGMER